MHGFLKFDASKLPPDQLRRIKAEFRDSIDGAKAYALQALAEGKTPDQVFEDLTGSPFEPGAGVTVPGTEEHEERIMQVMAAIGISKAMEERREQGLDP